ncbi:hypothetical protein M5689_010750 [Euphorbia peplus]|nr:hypothetical protein M5689_010750 [Euphorbia peplus]
MDQMRLVSMENRPTQHCFTILYSYTICSTGKLWSFVGRVGLNMFSITRERKNGGCVGRGGGGFALPSGGCRGGSPDTYESPSRRALDGDVCKYDGANGDS